MTTCAAPFPHARDSAPGRPALPRDGPRPGFPDRGPRMFSGSGGLKINLHAAAQRRGDVHQGIRTVIATVVRYANLFDTLANGGHRFEIVGWLPTLHLVQLIACIVPRILGKVPQTLERPAEEHHWPHVLVISDSL